MATFKHEAIAPIVRDLYIEGLSKSKISAMLEVDQAQIGYILYVQLKVHETHPRRQTGADLLEALPKEKVNKIITLSTFGYNNKEIAQDQEMLPSHVSKIVSEARKKNLLKKLC